VPTLPRALIVEDDPDNLSALSALLSGDGFLVDTAGSLAAARMHLLRALPDVILVDLHLPDGSGLDLLQTLPPLPQGTPPMIVLTGHATVESAIEGLRHGVWDYLIKPVNVPRLRALLARIPRTEALVEEIGALRAHLRRLGRFGPMVGRSATIQSVYDALEREAHTETPVLLWGEAGTGKQMAARAARAVAAARRPVHSFRLRNQREIAAQCRNARRGIAEHAVRPRTRPVRGRRTAPSGCARASERRHLVRRRDHRAAARRAGKPAQRDRHAPIHAHGQHRMDSERRARGDLVAHVAAPPARPTTA
jgi:CheY-like chemotaxis protein